MNNRGAQTTFSGAGCNDSSLYKAIVKASVSPSKKTLPAGATWPFATLTLDDHSADFSMAQIKKSAKPSSSSVSLGLLGYVYFHTGNHDNDFGFLTLRLGTLTKELRSRGYRLDETFSRNKLVARVSLFLMIAIPLAFLAVIIAPGIVGLKG